MEGGPEPQRPQYAAPAPVSPEGETPAFGPVRREKAIKSSFFGARKRARQLADEVDHLRAEHDRLGLLPLVELERRREALRTEIAEQGERLDQERREAVTTLEHERHTIQEEIHHERQEASLKKTQLENRLRELREEVVVTEETALLQEIGIYEYRHPLNDSIAYQAELKRLRDQIKTRAKEGDAILAATDWSVNGSAAQGRKMVRDYSKLMLRAYNAEADNAVRSLKPYKLASAVERQGRRNYRKARQDHEHSDSS